MADLQFLESEGEDDECLENGAIRKNLLDEFADVAKTEQTMSNNGRELMKVFLRIRPFTEEEKELTNNQECMEKDGDTAILLNAPKDSFTFKNEKRGREVTHRFTFSHVFGAETTQKKFFDNTTLDLVKDFMDGQNCLVFTYGVTNSGKTYTIQGNPKDGGILPRTLDVLFNSIQDRHYIRMNLKPRYFCDVVKINEKQEHMEGALRNGLLMSLNKEQFDLNSFLQLEKSNNDFTKSSIGDESTLQSSIRSQEGENIDNEIILNVDNDESRVADDTTVSLETQGPVKFSVWVSFAEVYNEQIYDLLEPCPEGKGKKRTTLKLGDDKHGNPYVKGLREICVSSADEAYKILRVGKKNQRIASTKLNQNSSRSHCIFNIKVLRVVNVDEPHVARVSRLSFVDLAGSERYTKTQSTGDRLKESGNINTSLLTLGKCLENLRYNQMHVNHSQIIPFRESKLTRLFQGFFCGKGKASMIVNINQCPETFDETYHALKFSAIAKQVTTRVSKPVDMALPVAEKSLRASFAFPTSSKVARMSIAWANGATKTPAVLDNECVEEEEEDDGSCDDKVTVYIKQLENLVKQFESQLIEEKKAKATLEFKIREEVCAEMAEQLVAIETEYSERIQEQVSAVEEKCDRRIEILAKSIKKTRKRARIDKPDDDDDERVTFAQLKAEKDKVQDLTAQIKELESNLNSMKTAFEESEKHLKDQEDVMIDLQNALETSSKELEIAKIKIDKRDRMIMEKDDLLEQLQQKLDEQTQALEDKENIVETKEAKIISLQNDLSQHQQALDDNESFLAQLNTQVKELSSELTDAKTKQQEHEDLEHMKDVRLETALTKKISKLREQLLARDELMKELVQSLEETRAQVELEKGDLVVICNEQKSKIDQLQSELEAAKNAGPPDNEAELASLKNLLKKAEDNSLNAQDNLETNCFEKEELQLTLDAANVKIKQLDEQLSSQKEKFDEVTKLHEESNSKVQELEVLLKNREGEIQLHKNEAEKLKCLQTNLQTSDEKVQSLKEQLKSKEEEVSELRNEAEKLSDTISTLETSNKNAKELFGKLESEVSNQEKSVFELEKLRHLERELHEENAKVVEELQKKERELNKFVIQVEALNEKLNTTASENEELRNKMSSAEEKLAIFEKEKQRMFEEQQKVIKLEEKLQTITKENEELKTQISSQEKDVAIFEKEEERKVQQLEDKLRITSTANKELQNKLNSTQAKISSLEGKTDKELAQTEQASNDIKELENQLKETTVALDKKNSQLISRNNTIKRLELVLSEKEAKIAELTKVPTTPTTPGRDFRCREEIKTLRRRLVQGDKENEDYKQKAQDYEKRLNVLNKKAEETAFELSQARKQASDLETKLSTTENELKEKVSSIERELKDAQEESLLLKEQLKASEKQLEVYRLQHEEAKQNALQSEEDLEKLKDEITKANEELTGKEQELLEMKGKAEGFEKKIEEVKLQYCEEVKKSGEEKVAMADKTKNVEKDLANFEEKLKNIEETKGQEISKLQEQIQTKEKMLTQKTEELESITKQFTNTEKEKSDELDKVWNTMVELQGVIKERGETIDELEEKLSKAEARHAREKNTLESTVAKIKDVMETKGSDRNKLLAHIAELEGKVSTLDSGNKRLIDASEKSEKDIEELRKVLEQQDAVMEEQQEALNERQVEVENLLSENTRLQEQLTNKSIKTENTAADVQRLEGTLSVMKEEKEKLENELKERRKEEENQQLSKVEICRDFEKEKSGMLVKLEKKEGNISKVKAQVKTLQTEKKALEQKCKEKEVEIKKLDERLQNSGAKLQEYENLVQLKDTDVRAAQDEKDTMLKAMREALAVASAKKEEFDFKIQSIEERHANEMQELRKQYEVELTSKMVHAELSDIEETPSDKPAPKTAKPTKQQPKDENDKAKRQRRTTRARKGAVSHDEGDVPTSTNYEEENKENSKDDVLRDITAVKENSIVKDLKDEPIVEDRIEIDVTPMQRRKRTSRAAGGSKNKPKKRRSSELPLSEVKSQLSAKRAKKEKSEDDLSPGSFKPKGRSTRNSSTTSSSSSRKRPPLTPMTPMNEESKESELKTQSSIKRKPFFGKLFSGSNSDTTPPKRGRKLLKKDISAPMESFSPCIASISTTSSSTKDKNKARTIITRQLRSRLVKN